VLLMQLVLLLTNNQARDALATFGLIGSQLLVSVMDLFAVAHFGIWMGLSQKTPAKAVTKTVLYVLLLPALGLCSFYLWPLIGVAKNLMFINYAQEKMRRGFRFIVTERYGMAEEPEIVGRPSARARQSQLPRCSGVNRES
jgi:phosphatidylglycerophosphate synthase